MIKDEVLALFELSNDLLFHKIPDTMIKYYIDESLNIGKKAAMTYSDKDIFEICKENNIQIEYIEKSNKTYGIAYRAQSEMDKSSCKFFIYKGSIEDLCNNCCDEIDKISYEQSLKIHLAHEFFHYLEYKQDKFVSDELKPVYRINMPFIKKKGHINRCSEIAANSFAKELLALEQLPNIYDYKYLIKKGLMSKLDFDKMVSVYEKKLNKN